MGVTAGGRGNRREGVTAGSGVVTPGRRGTRRGRGNRGGGGSQRRVKGYSPVELVPRGRVTVREGVTAGEAMPCFLFF